MSGPIELPATLPGHWETAEGLDKAREYATKARAELFMGDRTDLDLANAVFMADRHDLDLIHYQTAAKERMRWLSVQLALARAETDRWEPLRVRLERNGMTPAEAEPFIDAQMDRALAAEAQAANFWEAHESMRKALAMAQNGRADLEARLQQALTTLSGYRAASHWIGADAWDGCSQCMEVLQLAVHADPDRDMTPDQIALALAELRRHGPAAIQGDSHGR